MTGVLPLVTLAALATAITILLERGGRGGYGWVTGSEFVLFGIALGPVGLDLLSGDILEALKTALMLAAAWLGFRFGLRFRPSQLREFPKRVILVSQLEPLLVLLLLGGLLELVSRFAGIGLESQVAWAIAAMGSATTKSAAAWARAQLGAKGPLTGALEGVSTLNDLASIVGAAVLMPRMAAVATRLPAHVLAPLVATLVLGAGLGILVTLLSGWGRFRPDLGWIALFGAMALGCGLSATLGLSEIGVAGAAGLVVAGTSSHADQLEELTRNTERPVVLVLLLLGGAMLHGLAMAIAIGAAASVLRVVSKLGAGAVVSWLLPPGIRHLNLGRGLLGAGGVAFAVAIGMAARLPAQHGDLILASAIAMALLGDFVGSPMLRGLLDQAHETVPAKAAEEQPS